jgi:Protein kinase domain
MDRSRLGPRPAEEVAFSDPSAYPESLATPTFVTEGLRPGDPLGGYRIEAVIGAGGMGVVYRATDMRLGRPVALKVIVPARSRDERFRSRFLRESQLAASLDHSHIVPVYEAGESDARLYLAMRYVEGTDLRTLLAREAPLDADRALGLLTQVADALDAAHGRDLIHRDVKPANILVTEESGREHCYLSDFGLSRSADRATAHDGPTELSGTFAYTAPEQIAGGPVDGRADVYSLACVLYECLAGRTPFEGKRAMAVLFAHMQEEPPGLAGLTMLDGVLGRALAKDPAERHATCADLIRAARDALRAPELPPELDTVTPLIGRQIDLAWLRRLWREARGGKGRVAILVGSRGIGKTRLAAELAHEVAAEGGCVRYAGCVGGNEAAQAALAELDSSAPTLLVLDDLDAADESVLAAVAEAEHKLEGVPALVLGTSRTPAPGVRHREIVGLDSGAVAELATTLAGDAAPVLPLEGLLGDTGGVPLRVHEMVNEVLRAQASLRLAAAAGRTEAGWLEWRAAQAALRSDVVRLQQALERSDLPRRAEAPECPFKGLASFDIQDADIFFGREQLTAELVARLAGASLVGVVGPSGSGKSSVVRAGLLPALGSGASPGSEDWAQAVIRPGEHPLDELARATRDNATPRRILAVDQLEEIFTICRDEEEREEFLDSLVAASGDGVVIVVVRADFYGRFAPYAAFSSALAENHVLVGPMAPDELRRAIELPAAKAGLRCEPALVDSLVADVVDEPGGLPLLSTALVELWQGRDGWALRLDAYRRNGGVHGAVARLAEAAFGQLTPEQRSAARSILIRLADSEGERLTRRRASLSELDLEASADAERAVAVLTDSRLVTVREAEIEVAHEALLREWPRLRGWLEEDADGRRVHRHLIEAAKDWEARGGDPGDLYRGARLAAALDWAAEHPSDPNELEQTFLGASQEAAELESLGIRRANRRLRVQLAGVAVFLAAALGAGTVAAIQWRESQRDSDRAGRAARLAQARELAYAADAQAVNDQELSLLLAITAVNTTRLVDGVVTDEARQSLLSALTREFSPNPIFERVPFGEVITALPDGLPMSRVNGRLRLDTDGLLRAADSQLTRGLTDEECALFLHMSASPGCSTGRVQELTARAKQARWFYPADAPKSDP